jgi:hypothetical protein
MSEFDRLLRATTLGGRAGALLGPSAALPRFAPATSQFDPSGDGFDYDTALAVGMKRDKSGHMGSVAPATPEQMKAFGLPKGSFVLLKGRKHPTFHKAVEAERARGAEVIQRGGRYFSVPVGSLKK